MYSLTLDWLEEHRNCSQTLLSQQTKTPGLIRIGRDRDRCDLVLQHPNSDILRTVSSLHVEIFLNVEANRLCLRNLTRDRKPPKQPNPAFIDRRSVIDQEVPIASGTQIQLGKMTLHVNAVDLHKVEPPRATFRHVCKCTNPRGAHLLPPDYPALTCHCGYQVLGATVIYE